MSEAASAPALDALLAEVRARRDAVERRFGVRLLGVVGSCARGEARPDSDVDILARRTGRPSLFDLVTLEDELAEAFGRPVDLVFESALAPHWKRLVEADFVAA